MEMKRKKFTLVSIALSLVLALAGSMLLSQLTIGLSPEETSNQEAASSSLVPPAGVIFTGTYIKIGVNQGGTLIAPGPPAVGFQYPIGDPNDALTYGTQREGYLVAYKVWTGAAWEDRKAYYYYDRGWPPPASSRLTFVSALTVRDDDNRAVYRAILDTVDGVLRLTFEFSFPKVQQYVELKTTIKNKLTTDKVQDVLYKRIVDWDVHRTSSDNKWTNDAHAAYAWKYNHTWGRRALFSVSGYTAEAWVKLPTFVDLYAWDDYTIRGSGLLTEYSHEDAITFDGMAAIHYDLGDIAATASKVVFTVYQASDNRLPA